MLDFLADHYILFIIISLIMAFALIGYFVDTARESRFIKAADQESIKQSIEKAKATNMTLNQIVQNSKEQEMLDDTETLDDPITELLEKDS